jgi:hypothetical protein
MPFESKAQERLFQAAAHDPAFAERSGLPQKTAQKFIRDSKGQDLSKLPQRVQHKAVGGAVKRPTFKW